MKACIIFGGSGYIGTNLAKHFLEKKTFDIVYIADINNTTLEHNPGIVFKNIDVRSKITTDGFQTVGWIFNLAAIHREPGHEAHEYYTTNILGAKNVCDFAE